MARKSNSQNSSASLDGIALIAEACTQNVVNVVNYFLLNRALRDQVKRIDGHFFVDGYRIQIQPDENQRVEAGGVTQYHVLITESEPEFTEETTEVIKPIIVQLRAQADDLSTDIDAITSLMQGQEQLISEKEAVIARLKAEREGEVDEDRLDLIDHDIDDAQNAVAECEVKLTEMRAIMSEKSGLLINVSDNLADELNKGEMEVTVKRIKVNTAFPLETYVN